MKEKEAVAFVNLLTRRQAQDVVFSASVQSLEHYGRYSIGKSTDFTFSVFDDERLAENPIDFEKLRLEVMRQAASVHIPVLVTRKTFATDDALVDSHFILELGNEEHVGEE